tara:strand:+ start:4828 stop:5925 length:1098 start_codon:yes stop_codon:yes gene_type:complete
MNNKEKFSLKAWDPPLIGWILLFTTFLFGAFNVVGETNPNISFNFVNIFLLQNDTELIIKLLNYCIKIFFLLLPILVITIIELSILKDDGLFSLRLTSLGKFSQSKDKNKYSDIFYYIFSFLIKRFTFLVAFLTLGLSYMNSNIESWFNSLYNNIIPIPTTNLSSAIVMIIAILLSSLSGYIRHYLSHKVDFIWDLHEFHHSATEMNIFCKDRNIPIESAIQAPFIIPVSVLSGLLMKEYMTQGFMLPTYIYIFYLTMEDIGAYGGHCSFPIIYPKPFSYIFMSPACHLLHHSVLEKHYDCNLGNSLTIWDKVFGTYLDESHLSELEGFGVKDSKYNKNYPLFAMFALPKIKLLKRLFPNFRYKF